MENLPVKMLGFIHDVEAVTGAAAAGMVVHHGTGV